MKPYIAGQHPNHAAWQACNSPLQQRSVVGINRPQQDPVWLHGPIPAQRRAQQIQRLDEHNAMADTIDLTRRNAALEAELRFTQEQLNQAYAGGTYLINTLGRQQQPLAALPYHNNEELESLRYQLQKALRDNATLRSDLARANRPASIREQASVRGWRSQERRAGRMKANDWGWETATQSKHGIHPEGADLLGWDEAVRKDDVFGKPPAEMPAPGAWSAVDGSRPTSSLPASGLGASKGKLGNGAADSVHDFGDQGPFGLGTQGITYHKHQVSAGAPTDGESAYIDMDALAAGHEPTPPTIKHDEEPSDNYRGLGDNVSLLPNNFRPFGANLHNSLSGCACFVEDLDEPEKAAYWERFAHLRKDRSAAEYSAYYEAVIRPKYQLSQLQKEIHGLEKEIETKVLARQDSKIGVGGSESTDVDDASREDRSQANNAVSSPPGNGMQLDTKPSAGQQVEWNDDLVAHEQARTSLLDTNIPSSDRNATVDHKVLPVADHSPGKIPLEHGLQIAPENSLLGSAAQIAEARAFQQEVARGLPRAGRRSRFFGGNHEQSTRRTDPPNKNQFVTENPTLSNESSDAQPISRLHEDVQVSEGASREAPASGRLFRDRADNRPWEYKVSYFGQSGDPDLRRTILISNIPNGTTLAEVLDQVHGGRIVRAKFVDTVGLKTIPPLETNTVLIEFFGSRNALRYRDYCNKRPVSLTAANGSQQQAQITLLTTATRPIPPYMVAAIHDIGLSRIVYVHDRRGEVNANYLTSKACIGHWAGRDWDRAKMPIKTEKQDGGLVTLEFASLEDAGKAYSILRNERDLAAMEKGFVTDPCFVRKGVEMEDEDDE